MTVLIITRKDDVHVDMVVQHLSSMKVEFFRLNTECAEDYLFRLDLEGGYIINTITGLKLDLTNVKSVYLRRRSVPDNPLLSDQERIFADREWRKFLQNLWVSLRDKKWVNKPLSLEVSKDKLLQLKLAREIGFNVPNTLMSNSLSEVKGFAKQLKIVYKAFDGGSLYPGSSRSIYTSVLTNDILENTHEESLRVCPGFFQEYVEKRNELRVTIIGKNVFATEIDSQSSESTKIDWRKYEREFVEHKLVQLSQVEIDMCLQILGIFDLEYAAIDLIRNLDGSLTFLEVNSNGQWAWIEVLTKAPIAATIAKHLSFV